MATETNAPATPAAANIKPVKPDEALFKEQLAKAEKELKESQDRLVSCIRPILL